LLEGLLLIGKQRRDKRGETNKKKSACAMLTGDLDRFHDVEFVRMRPL